MLSRLCHLILFAFSSLTIESLNNFIYKCIAISRITSLLFDMAASTQDEPSVDANPGSKRQKWKGARSKSKCELNNGLRWKYAIQCNRKMRQDGIEMENEKKKKYMVSLEYKLSPLLEPIAMYCKSFFIQFFVVVIFFALSLSLSHLA